MTQTEKSFLKDVVIGSIKTPLIVTIFIQIFRLVVLGSFGLDVMLRWFIVLYIIAFTYSSIKHLIKRGK